MHSQKVSPNSAEMVAQLEAGRKGVKAKFCLRFRIASAVLTLLISAAIFVVLSLIVPYPLTSHSTLPPLLDRRPT